MQWPQLEWSVPDDPLEAVAFATRGEVVALVQSQSPELADLFPFRGGWEARAHFSTEWFALTVLDRPLRQIPSLGVVGEDELVELRNAIEPFIPRSPQALRSLLGPGWSSWGQFTYVGPFDGRHASWRDIQAHLRDWLNQVVVPEVLRRNQLRVQRAIPRPPQFDLGAIRASWWVLESESASRQGTAFALDGVGLVTCSHVVAEDTVAFRAQSPATKFPVEVLARDATIDLATLRNPDPKQTQLRRGGADDLRHMDHLLVAGFPNFRLGDSGVVTPGLVVGFRTVSGIRRVLTNAPIVAGMSGGPALGAGGAVVGVAVTGADRMETANDTENHGIIPIEALQYLQS